MGLLDHFTRLIPSVVCSSKRQIMTVFFCEWDQTKLCVKYKVLESTRKSELCDETLKNVDPYICLNFICL
jgi:hypothetical protein